MQDVRSRRVCMSVCPRPRRCMSDMLSADADRRRSHFVRSSTTYTACVQHAVVGRRTSGTTFYLHLGVYVY